MTLGKRIDSAGFIVTVVGMLGLLAGVATIAVVCASATASIVTANDATAAAKETMYYGKTSQGLAVSIPVKGQSIARDDRAYVLFRIRHSDPLEFHPGQQGATNFAGGHLNFHRSAKLPGGTIEVWFQAALIPGGRLMSGMYRERHVGFSAPVSDIRTTFTATAWASQQGRDWLGKTADGKPMRLTVRYRLDPGHTIINGKRPLRPTYSVSLSGMSRSLACRNADGTKTAVVAALPALSAELSGTDDLANAFGSVIRAAGLTPKVGLSTTAAATGTATTEDTTVSAQLTIKRLAWQGSGLAATGTLSYQGTAATETGGATCPLVTTTFTVRPS